VRGLTKILVFEPGGFGRLIREVYVEGWDEQARFPILVTHEYDPTFHHGQVPRRSLKSHMPVGDPGEVTTLAFDSKTRRLVGGKWIIPANPP